MFRVTLAIILASIAFSVHADEFYVALQVECSKTGDYVAVNYLGAYNEEGKAMVQRLGEDGIDPWKLVVIADDHISEMKTLTKQCSLSDGIYIVDIGPLPGNGNIQGRCGAQMSAWMRIHKDDTPLLRTGFEGDCFADYPVTTRVLWRAGAEKAEITEVAHDEFYK